VGSNTILLREILPGSLSRPHFFLPSPSEHTPPLPTSHLIMQPREKTIVAASGHPGNHGFQAFAGRPIVGTWIPREYPAYPDCVLSAGLKSIKNLVLDREYYHELPRCPYILSKANGSSFQPKRDVSVLMAALHALLRTVQTVKIFVWI
jgi:hypothetical protein